MNLVPRAKNFYFPGRFFPFRGVKRPSFPLREFGIKEGPWEIVEVRGEGYGLEVREGKIEVWGDKSPR